VYLWCTLPIGLDGTGSRFVPETAYDPVMSKFQRLMICRAFACGFLLFPLCIYGQSSPLERRASDFDSRGVGLTETLLKFSHEEHLPMAIEYVDQASMDQPIDISLRNKTIRQALNSILLNRIGYEWRARNEIIEITNKHASKRAAGLLNKVIPAFCDQPAIESLSPHTDRFSQMAALLADEGAQARQ
jgi:hypothetical protein